MHGHGMNECFRKYPHLCKEKDSSKQLQGNVVNLESHENMIRDLGKLEGNTPEMTENTEDPL
ncbi:hypothetical protein IEQ34_018654 [Dendrobium chrysotoxum]|uniref:Uncharacterized protein n=1 Tax=Dendrobium chrysotoxum TaxID=161865 RepID=A0AAV7G6D1_DENCH|nr:hypothetical protein IEQ34_018654 [Dendrobium chrysotoxum]